MDRAAPPSIFDPRRRAALQRRADGQAFLLQWLAAELTDRLACSKRSFDSALVLGPVAAQADAICAGRAREIATLPIVDEGLGLDAASHDLIVAGACLESLNDLPGALIQIRRALRPDGLFLGAMFGAGALAALKATMLLADGERAAAHVHPQIELRVAADLLARAGFALQVADQDELEIRYSDWRKLIGDLRDAGLGNALAGARPYLGKSYPERLDRAWRARAAADGKVSERFCFIHLSGWCPSPTQPKPAPRGSGRISLEHLLGKPDE